MGHTAEQLLEQFRYFTNLMHRERSRSDFGGAGGSLNRSQGHLLGLLLQSDGLSQKELSQQLQIRPASLGELVDKLERNGYVERRINSKDKRLLNVYLTPAGRQVVSEVIQARRAMLDTIFAALSDAEKSQLHVLMAKLIHSLEAADHEDFE